MSTEPNLENLLIPLEEIKSGTDNFSLANCIGGGGFGKVYKGKLAEFRTTNVVAIKRLDPNSFQGKHEFKNEVSVLSSYKHENLIGFIGYCDKGDEMIIIYEYAINGSLDKHLCSRNKLRDMVWLRRLEICVGAARGLNHLHSGFGVQTGIIHRDVKSANILLDENWKARVSDFGLSKFCPEDQSYTHINTRAAGTPGYCDPYYRGTDILSKESDVFSLGVVLFEMLCGRLVFPTKHNNEDDDSDSRSLLGLVWRHRDDLEKIIDLHIRDLIGPKSLGAFKEIAMQCVEFDYRQRPTMTVVVEKLEEALDFQIEHEHNESWMQKLLHDYEGNCYNNKDELHALLSQGVLFDEGKKWLSLSKSNGKNCLVISVLKLFKEKDKSSKLHVWSLAPQSRFKDVAELRQAQNFTHKMHIDTKWLSSETAYAVLLICRGGMIYGSNFCHYGRKEISTLGFAQRRDDEWMEIELFQFINNMDTVTVEFHIEWYSLKFNNDGGEGSVFWVEGVECRPIDMDQFDLKKQARVDYEDIVQRSNTPLVYNTKNELDSLLYDGILIDQGTKWFELSRLNGKNSLIISAMGIFEKNDRDVLGWNSKPKSRFSKVAKHGSNTYTCQKIHITTEMLSLETTYAVIIIGTSELVDSITCCNRKYFLEQWKDNGIWQWKQAELFHFTNLVKVATLDFDIKLYAAGYIEGIEFRPIDAVSQNPEEENEVGEFQELEFDSNWKQKIPSDYQEILQRASDVLKCTSRKEAYSVLMAGIFMDDYSLWFYLDKSSGKKCTILSPETLIVEHSGMCSTKDENSRFSSVQEGEGVRGKKKAPLLLHKWFCFGKSTEKNSIMLSPKKMIVEPEGKLCSSKDENSRFSSVLKLEGVHSLIVHGKMEAQMLSPMTHYAAWLVFKIDFDGKGLNTTASLTLGYKRQLTRHVFLTPSSECIHLQKEVDSEHQKRLDRRPWKRNDGWMEVELFSFFNDLERDTEIKAGLQATCEYYWLGLLVQGIEFRPRNIKVDG